MNSSSAPTTTQRVSRPFLSRPARLGASLLLGLACLAPATLPAASLKEELARSTPVPADQPIPLVDFLRPARLGRPKLNPSGTHFAALFNVDQNREELLIVDLATGKKNLQTSEAGPNLRLDITAMAWLTDTRLIYLVGAGKAIPMGLFSSEYNKPGAPQTLARFSEIDLLELPRAEPTHPLLWIKRDLPKDGEDRGVVQIDGTQSITAQSRSASLAAPLLASFPKPPEGETENYITGRDGGLAYAVTTHGGHPALWQWEGKTWNRCALDVGKFRPIGIGDGPDELIVSPAPEPGQPNTLVRINTRTGVPGQVLLTDKDYVFKKVRLMRAQRDGRLLGAFYTREKPTNVWFDEGQMALHEKLRQAMPDRPTYELSRSVNEERSIIGAASDVLPEEYYLYDHKSAQLTPLGKSRPWIAPERMQPMHVLNYVSRDGLRIDALITLPKGASRQKPSPLVVLPHDSASAGRNWGWDSMAQLFASRGYAVFQPNYRGSGLRGWQFPDASALFLKRMQEDVNDGVRFLIRNGLADPSRVAILGEGFGAYLSLGCATTDPELYRCCATISGIYNWEKIMRKLQRFDSSAETYRRMERILGNPKENKPLFDEISPLRQLSKLKTPVLVTHSDDSGTPIDETTELLAALEKAGVPCEKVLKEARVTNRILTLENQVAIYTAIEGFLARNMAPLPPPEKQAK